MLSGADGVKGLIDCNVSFALQRAADQLQGWFGQMGQIGESLFLHFVVFVTIRKTQESGVIGFTVLYAFDGGDVHGGVCLDLVSTDT